MTKYIISPTQGTVTRTEDNVVIAPCQSDKDPNWLEYIAWVESGNIPDEVE